jgi:hypothetical protein
MKKKLLLLSLISLLSINSFAFDDGFDTTDSGFDSAFSESADFSDNSFSTEDANKLDFEFNGELNLINRVITGDIKDIKDNELTIDDYQKFKTELKVSKANSELKANFLYDSRDEKVKIDEATFRLFYDKYDVLVGKTKLVWGKGDKVHVIDNFNAEDMSDIINPDYLDRKMPENLVQLNYYVGNGNLEFVYAPKTTTTKLADNDLWKTSTQKYLESTLETTAKKLITLDTNVVDVYSMIDEIEAQLYGDNKIDNGQYGIRYTNSKNGYDYGVSFYHGVEKTPTIDMTTYSVSYKKYDIIGTEFSAVLFGINSRAELAYYNIEDSNNQVKSVVGGDKDLPLHNINVNLQVKTEYTQNLDDDNFVNTVVAKISDKFKNERILPEIQVVYNVEDKDYMLNNQVEFKVKDDTSFKVMYKIFEGDTGTTFGDFDSNDYLAANFVYRF